jgi:cell division protein ZapA (FtsZ GTPase activity inhibitor)
LGKTRLTLSICGIDYAICSDESEEYMRKIAQKVNDDVLRIINSNSRISVSMATTLVALEYCDAAKKATVGTDNLRVQIKNYLEDISEARLQIENQKTQIEALRLEMKALKMNSSYYGSTLKD